MSKSYRELREEAKQLYKNIGSLDCPAFPDEKVYFFNNGFKHLMYKDKRFRPIIDQVRRFEVLKFVREILLSASSFSEYRVEKGTSTTAYFWAFEGIKNGKVAKVVLRKIDNGPLHFFSVRSY